MKSKNVTSYINQDEISSYLKDIRKIDVMTKERESEICQKLLSGELKKEDIYNELIEGNLRFVIKIAKEYQNQGMEFNDLVAEGNVGLLKAIEYFDWTKNIRFISYAVWWIRQSIIQSLNENSRTIRLPVNVVQKVVKNEYEGQIPTTIDIDSAISDEGLTLIDLLVNKNADNPEKVFDTSDILKEKLSNLLNILDEREKIIIQEYFGLNGSSRTLEDIGYDFDLTKERVRQIKEKALKKVRNECSELFEYL